MIDALLEAVRDAVRRDLGYQKNTCDVMADGRPSPAAGDVFLAIHSGSTSCGSDNSKDERYAWQMTLTMRVSAPDRAGDLALLARQLAKKVGWYRRVKLLSDYLHMDWGLLQEANTLLAEYSLNVDYVYGFCEPARFSHAEQPVLVGGEWFWADTDASNVGVQGSLFFEDCRRLQPYGMFR